MKVFNLSLLLSRNCRWIEAMCVSVQARCGIGNAGIHLVVFPFYTWLVKKYFIHSLTFRNQGISEQIPCSLTSRDSHKAWLTHVR